MIPVPLSFFDFLVDIAAENIKSATPIAGCANPKEGLASQSMTESIYLFVLGQLDAMHPRDRWETVAKETKMSLSTIKKIARKEVKNPGVKHIEKLAKYFREQVVA